MYALRRTAQRLLASRPVSLASSSRNYKSLVTPSHAVLQRVPAFQSQRRWATTEAERESETNPAAARDNTTQQSTQPESTASTSSVPPTDYSSQTYYKPSNDSFQPQSFATGFEKKRTIYIGNLFFDVTETELVKEFSRFGEIARCRVIRDSRGLSKGFAYIDFNHADHAEEAIRTMNLQLYEGRRMTVQYSARETREGAPNGAPRDLATPRVRNPPSKTLFIGNISFEMTDRDLASLFRTIRNVIDVRVAIDRRTGQPRGFAHADFVDVKSATDAMQILREKETYGRRLRVDYSFSSSQAPRNRHRDESGQSGPQVPPNPDSSQPQ